MNPSASANLLTPYETFLERFANFRELNILPVPFGHFGENVTVEDLAKNKANWHRSCHKKFEEGTFCFKFADLCHLFEKHLKEFGIDTEVYKVRFKEKILSYFHEAQAQSDGKNILLIFQQGMQQILKHVLNTDYESDAMILAKAARIIRKDIFNFHGFHFSGSFPPGCQQESVPINLKYLSSMLLNGPNLKDQDSTDSQPIPDDPFQLQKRRLKHK